MAESQNPTSKLPPREMIAIGSMCVMIVLILVRAMSSHEPFPVWDSDPYLFGSPLTGITSGYAILLNAAIMTLGLVVLLLSPVINKSDELMRALLGVGGIGLGIHLLNDPANLVNGSTLGAMMCSAVAARVFLTTRPHWSRVCIPVVLGAGILLGIYGFHQVFIQHPQTVEMYEQNKQSFLNSRGWTDGSFEVMSYERRLRQPEPTGWFGLANVYASFIAAFGIGMVMVTLCSIRKAWWMLSGLVAGLLLVMLLISKSKGGIGAAVLGFGVLQYALARNKGRVSRIGTSTVCACVLVMLGVVAGAMMHQLSLLFRGQYMVGSLRIFAEHPILGVGPGKFQDAYMVLKPSTSPEDVTSAHNLVFDLIAQLGMSGIAWIVVLMLLIWTARIPKSAESDETDVPHGVIVRVILLMTVAVGITVIKLQTNAMDLELMLFLLVGIGLWAGGSLLLARFGSLRTLQLAMLGAAVVLSVHAMLDLTPVWVGSASLFGLCIGMGFRGDPNAPTDRRGPLVNLIPAAGLGCVIVLSGMGARTVIARDQQLIAIGGTAQEIARLRMELLAIGASQSLADEVSMIGGIPVGADGQSIFNALNAIEMQDRTRTSLALLNLAGTIDDPKVQITALEHAMRIATMLDNARFSDIQTVAHDEETGNFWTSIDYLASRLSDQGTTYRELNWAGIAYRTMSERAGLPEDMIEILRDLVWENWVRADALNPNDPKHAIRLMELAIERDDAVNGSKWASEGIKRSDRMRLDPLKQLSREVLARAKMVSERD
tara:strand:- start:159490 stop:161805 length:2316 start_codon:yes stop_codon:yes gene_type:complete